MTEEKKTSPPLTQDNPYYNHGNVILWQGNALGVLSGMTDKSVQTCVTSPPYWRLRDYGDPKQLGMEETPAEYISKVVEIFREVRRVLKDDGTLWLNLGDSYATGGNGGQGLRNHLQKTGWRSAPEGLKHKDMVGIPWRVALSLQADGWYLRRDIIWAKPNPTPESVVDRPTSAHEYIFLMSKKSKYYYDGDAIKEPALTRSKTGVGWGYSEANPKRRCIKSAPEMRIKRSVWTIPTVPFPDAHFATFPPNLIKPCILAGCPPGGNVLDPFVGSGTTCFVAKELTRRSIGIDLHANYLDMAVKRLRQDVLSLDIAQND